MKSSDLPNEVTIVLGSFNRKTLIPHTIATVRDEIKSAELDAQIVVVDGGSSDGTVKWLLTQKDIITVIQHNRGTWRGRPLKRRSWGYFMNLAFRCSGSKYVCMLSDDCLVVPGAIRNGIERAERLEAEGRRIGGVAFYWRNWPEGDRYQVGLTLGDRMFVNHGLYTRAALEAVGYIDEDLYRFYHADSDLGLKMWEAGFECVDSEGSFIEHFYHTNFKLRRRNHSTQAQDWHTFINKWKGRLYKDGDSLGGAKEIAYDDPQETAARFRRTVDYFLRYQLHRVIRLGKRVYRRWRSPA